MKHWLRPRKSANLPESISRCLNMYALAASTAGVGMLALAQPAQAKIVYTPADKWIPLGQSFYVDLNHDGTNDFRFWLASANWSTSFNRGTFRSLNVEVAKSGQTKNAFYASVSQNYPCAPPLRKGKTIGPKSPFSGPGGRWLFLKSNESGISSQHHSVCHWLGVKQAYLGVKFMIKGQAHYGWIRLGSISAGPRAKAKLTGYAYETIPGKAITAGATKGPDDTDGTASTRTPEPATLGILALGASGLSTWRREESAAAVPESNRF